MEQLIDPNTLMTGFTSSVSSIIATAKFCIDRKARKGFIFEQHPDGHGNEYGSHLRTRGISVGDNSASFFIHNISDKTVTVDTISAYRHGESEELARGITIYPGGSRPINVHFDGDDTFICFQYGVLGKTYSFIIPLVAYEEVDNDVV